jgi:hypothetical protein
MPTQAVFLPVHRCEIHLQLSGCWNKREIISCCKLRTWWQLNGTYFLYSTDFVLTVASQKMQIEKSKVGWLQIPTMILLHLLLVWPLNVLNNTSKQLILCTGSAPLDTLLLQIAIISDDGAWTLHYQNRLSAETPQFVVRNQIPADEPPLGENPRMVS